MAKHKPEGTHGRAKPGATTEAVRPPERGQTTMERTRANGDELVRVRVRAGMMGYHGDKRRRSGDVFSVPARMYSDRWMERVDPATPERITTGNEELRKKHDEMLAGAAVSGQGASAGLKPASDDEENPLGS